VAGRILAVGGWALGSRFDDLVLDLAKGPRVLFVPTPATWPEPTIVSFYESG
jgi:hypothetical protein